MEKSVLLNAIINNAIDGLITLDKCGTIETINPAACKLFEYNEIEILGNNISLLMDNSDCTKNNIYNSKYKKPINTIQMSSGSELIGVKKSGKKFPFRLIVTEVKYDGRMVYAGFIHDLTREKQSESLLHDYASQLEEQVQERTVYLQETVEILQQTKIELSFSLKKEKELNKLKSRFVSIASHEFRSPLSLIQLSASLIEKYAEEYKNQDINKHVGKINEAVLSISEILNDSLSIEKLDARLIIPEYNCFNLKDFAKEIAEEMTIMVKRGQKIIYKHVSSRQQINLDPNLLKNCIIILLDNAIKYSGNTSSIYFYTKVNKKNFTIRICDNGIGIPEENQESLFQAFFRANNTGKIPGNGLGLTILSRYIELMNGKINFKSKVNHGSLFTINFPQA